MARGRTREAHVTVKFDMTKMTKEQKKALFEASNALLEAGISFDTGSDGMVFDWELDWSLKGPAKVIFRKMVGLVNSKICR
jgi:hypothetical protein